MAASANHSAYLPAAVVELNTGSDTDSGSNNDIEMSSRECRVRNEHDAAGVTEQEVRAQRRRELNRLASERSRQKRKKRSDEINEELRRQEARNIELRRIADSLTGRLHVADRLLRIVSGSVGGSVGGGQQSSAVADAGAASPQRKKSSTEATKAGMTACCSDMRKIPAAPAASVERRRGSRSAPY